MAKDARHIAKSPHFIPYLPYHFVHSASQANGRAVFCPDKLKDELGDVLWYIWACADELGLTLTEIAEFNVNKLAKRHGR